LLTNPKIFVFGHIVMLILGLIRHNVIKFDENDKKGHLEYNLTKCRS